jgi:trehalose/maltose transport system permease protein
MAAVIMVDVWKTTPFMALLILAGMQMLPGDIYEAAKVDGVHPVKVFFKVTLP